MIADIWNSFRSMPLWVQIWVAFILAPVNMASLLFIYEPWGLWVAFLANIAMIPNLPIIFYERGFSKLMAFPHIPPWTILVVGVSFVGHEATGFYDIYLWILITVNVISLAFDYTDAWKWLKGDRKITGK